MAEYIEREALAQNESICRSCFHSYVCEQFNEHRDSDNKKCHFFNDHFVPAADVVEVRHGEWLPHYELFVNEPFDTTPYREQTGWKCSLCGRVECAKEPYCHCGAKMDGKGEGE